MDTGICTKCETEKVVADFYSRKEGKLGHTSWCKQCYADSAKEKQKEPGFSEKSAIASRKSYKKKTENWTPEEREEANRKRRENRNSKKEEENSKRRQKRAAQTPEQRKAEYGWYQKSLKNNPNLKLANNLRNRLNKVIKHHRKAGSAVGDLGCSLDDFYLHLESKFQPGMTWENWGVGKGKWHIDHIIPLSAFDLTQRQHLILACYYLNMQPMWSEENISKGNRY